MTWQPLRAQVYLVCLRWSLIGQIARKLHVEQPSIHASGQVSLLASSDDGGLMPAM